ncbi:dihydrofolate reductase family protein [Geodermatophilus normandii]|uniref:dihydrofolate reductase family protein n=1 Tax=Geodermatophilus normandii TaxID=1137989 RepID=UPI0031F303ED
MRGRGPGRGRRPCRRGARREHGASAAHALLQAGQLDEMEIHLVPVPLGGGRRLFEDRTDRVELELVRRLDGRDATHLRHRVRR